MGKLPQAERVLIVDDDEDNVEVLASALENGLDSVSVYRAYDGASSLRMAEIVRPDLILLDINMPEMNGIEVCERLKSHEDLSRVPVIFVTALSDNGTHESAIRAGGYGFISKPIQGSLVASYVKQALRMKHLDEEGRDALANTRGMVGMLVHDLKNLLHLNHGYLEVLKSELRGEGKLALVEMLESTVKEMTVLTSAILEVKRSEVSGMSVHIESFDACALARKRFSYMEPVDGARVMKLVVPRKMRVESDPVILGRVLDNLLLNALKFTPRGGEIELKLRKVSDQLELSVTNEGNPIPHEWHEKIFEPFGQMQMRLALKKRGVGLGLAFCRLAMEELGGKISVKSPLENTETGVSFIVRIPLKASDIRREE